MRIVMFGLPGAGKGTQAKWLAKALKVPHVSTGQIFRDALTQGTPLGLQAKSYTDGGNLVPDDIVIGIVLERFASGALRDGFILDGFPRTLPQGEALDTALEKLGTPIDHVIELDVAPETVVVRLSGRRLCSGCGKDFNVHYRVPRVEGTCDYCGMELRRRADDEPNLIRRRLEVDGSAARPLREYYSHRGKIVTIFGEDSIETVFRKILARLGRTWP